MEDAHRPLRCIDPETGTVTLRLHPFHLERLHGPWQGDPPDDPASKAGLPFPIRRDAPPVTVRLSPATGPEPVPEAEWISLKKEPGGWTWWHWYAYAETRMGFIMNAHPYFQNGRLVRLFLPPFRAYGPEEFLRAERGLINELGRPHQKEDAPPTMPSFLDRHPWRRWRRKWHSPWGSVVLRVQGPDWDAEALITWSGHGDLDR